MSSRKEQKEQLKREREAAEAEAAAATSRGRRLKIIGGVVVAAVAVVAIAVVVSLGGTSSTKVNGAAEVEKRLKGIPQSGLTLGKPDAPVTIVEFVDLKCPVCKEFSVGAFPTIVDKYIKTGKVKIELRIQSFLDQATPGTPDSTNAAKMALSVSSQNKLWNFAELWYINQKNEAEVFATDAWLKKIGGGITGLDVNKALAERTAKADAIDKQLAEASDKFTGSGFDGTPSFLIGRTGGELTELAYQTVGSPDDYVAAIDAELK